MDYEIKWCVSKKSRVFLWKPMRAFLCPELEAGEEALRSSPSSCFSSFQMSNLQDQENWVEFLKSSRILWEHISLSPHILGKK